MNILSIGNSFSHNAHYYLHQIAKADGFELNTFNLFIGGCPISTHFRNMLSEQPAYYLGVNGLATDFKVSLKEALLTRNWDVITIQQASHESPYYDKYQPYLNKLIEYVRECVPKAKIAFHQTWAYEQGSKRLNEMLGYTDQKDMFNDIKSSVERASKDINADFIIPAGEVFQELLASGIEKIHADTFHASIGIGQYALGLIWYSVLSGNSITDNTFSGFAEEISSTQIEIIKKCVTDVYERNFK